MKWKLFRSQEGSALPIVALGTMMLLAATGTAVDMGRMQIVQTKMQNALDATGLAIGSEVSTTNLSSETTKYFYANFPTGYLGTTVTSLTATANADNSVINLAATGTLATSFMQLFGIKSMAVSAASQITRASSGMELVLVLDNTGSMASPVNSGNSSTTKMAALKSAAAQLIGILYGSNATIPNLWVGVVPFTQAVNIGTGHPSWMNTSYTSEDFGPALTGTNCPSYGGTSPSTPGTYNSDPGCNYAISSTTNHTPPVTNFGSTNWAGCVMARTAPYDTSDDPPSSSLFQAYYYPPVPNGGTNYNPWLTSATTSNRSGSTTTYKTTTTYNYGYSSSILANYGPNALCPQPVTPMVAEQSTVLAAVNSMVAAGDTDLDLGLVWGWRMLSPRWQGLWGGEMNANSLPLAYNTPLMNKVVIFMTDGMNAFISGDYSGYGFLNDGQLGTTNETTAESTMDTRTLAVCTAMKKAGIIIYTIGFGTNGGSSSTAVNVNLLTSCATDANHFFLAPTNAQLATAFQQIGDSLANLRVSQ